MKKRKILFLTFRFPFPLRGGDKVKAYHLLQHLAKHNDLTVVTFYQGDEELSEEYIHAVKSLGLDLHVIHLHPMKAAINSILTNNPLNPLEINYYNQKEYQNCVDKLIAEKDFDIAMAFFMRTAEYLKKYPKLKKILIAEDCRVLYQQRSYKSSNNILQRAIRYYEYNRLKKYEPKIMREFDCVTAVTHNDIDAFKAYAPNIDYRLLSNGTEVDYYVPNPSVKKEYLVFTGRLNLWANNLMIDEIVGKIMPIIWKEYPNIKLQLVGANPTNEVLKLASDQIEIHQNVVSFLPYLHSAIAFIHPHMGGTGIQNKLLEAMSCGVPVITTKTGNQGINGVHRESIMIGNSSDEIAQLTLEVIRNKALAENISQNARKLIVDTHSWDMVYNDLDSIIEEILSNKA